MIGDLHFLVSFQDLLRLQPDDDDDDHYYYKDPQIIKPTFFINSFKLVEWAELVVVRALPWAVPWTLPWAVLVVVGSC